MAELPKLPNAKNVYLRGIGHRYRGLQARSDGCPGNEVVWAFILSAQRFENSVVGIELAFTYLFSVHPETPDFKCPLLCRQHEADSSHGFRLRIGLAMPGNLAFVVSSPESGHTSPLESDAWASKGHNQADASLTRASTRRL
jgi:hypothetical protein